MVAIIMGLTALAILLAAIGVLVYGNRTGWARKNVHNDNLVTFQNYVKKEDGSADDSNSKKQSGV